MCWQWMGGKEVVRVANAIPRPLLADLAYTIQYVSFNKKQQAFLTVFSPLRPKLAYFPTRSCSQA